MDLFSPVTDLRGVGPARAAALQRLGIFTLYDLLAYFPRDYEDRTNPVEIAQLQPGVPACFEALVVSQPVLRRIGKGRDVTNLTVADETGKLTLHYFNQPYIKTQLHYGERYYFYGALLERGMQMANPAFEEAGRPGTVTNRLLPVYPLRTRRFPMTPANGSCVSSSEKARPSSGWRRSLRSFRRRARCRSFCRRRCGSSTACAA